MSVEKRRFVSPTFQRKFNPRFRDSTSKTPYDQRFNPNPNDNLKGWLEENALDRIKEYDGERYFMVGEDGTTHVISASARTLQNKEFPRNISEQERKDDFYKQEITIKSQPAGRTLPGELEIFLKNSGYEPVSEFVGSGEYSPQEDFVRS